MDHDHNPSGLTQSVRDEHHNQIGLLESILMIDGRFPFLSDHLHRLSRGAERLNLTLPNELQAIEQANDFLLEHIPAVRFGARVKVKLSIRPRSGQSAHISIECEGLPEWTTTELISVTAPKGYNPFSGNIKTTERALYSAWFDQAKAAGVKDALVCTPEGYVVETTIGNMICFRDGEFLLPDHSHEGIEGILLGRLRVRFEQDKIPFRKISLPTESLASMEGVWVVNAVRGPLIVRTLNNRSIPVSDQASKILTGFFAEWTGVGI